MENNCDLLLSDDTVNIDFLNFLKENKLYHSTTDVLVKAIVNNNKIVFDYMLSKKININLTDSIHGSTPIMFAAQNGRVSMVKDLLLQRADISDDNRGQSALHFALSNINHSSITKNDKNFDCAKLLIQAGANVECNYICNDRLWYYTARFIKQEMEFAIEQEKAAQEKAIEDQKAVQEKVIAHQISIQQKDDEAKAVPEQKAAQEKAIEDQKAVQEKVIVHQISIQQNDDEEKAVPEQKAVQEKATSKNDYDEFVTTDGDTIKIPLSLPKPKIKMLCKNELSVYQLYTLATYVSVLVKIGDNWKYVVLSGNYEIEVPENKINYHYLPVGAILNDKPTSEAYVCKFAANFHVYEKDESIRFSNMYI